MKIVNTEYDRLFENFKEIDETITELVQGFKDVISKLINLEGLEIEVCGTWVWISGNTRQYKDKIKETGCKWASNKKMWFWRSEEDKWK